MVADPSSTAIVEDSALPEPAHILNVNVGVLGHVDSGKTSLVKALSTLLSTAALDKSTQSKERGMTLDLGFSCFFVDLPPHFRDAYPDKSQLQITLVDCPGHASLIRTIIGGAQIIDTVLLVVDAAKGWQAQTTECLVLAELTAPHLVVALNKADLFDPSERDALLREAEKRVRQRLAPTRFADAPILGVAACVGGEKVAAIGVENVGSSSAPQSASVSSSKNETLNVDRLVELLREKLPPPRRVATGPFYFSIDHCFSLRGRGTILTGTVLNGSASVNDVLEFPTLALERKVKSLQMFRRQVPFIRQGDRAGICVANLDAKLLERGIAASPGVVQLWKSAIALVKKVPYYPGTLPCGSKFHVSVGHATVMATVTFWGARELLLQQQQQQQQQEVPESSDPRCAAPANPTSAKCAPLSPTTGRNNKKFSADALQSSSLGGGADVAGLPRIPFDYDQPFLHQDRLLESLNAGGASDRSEEKDLPSKKLENKEPLLHWALLEFQTPVYCPVHSLAIGSRLDAVDVGVSAHTGGTVAPGLADTVASASSCRLAFAARLMERVDPDCGDLRRLRIYTPKERRGVVSKLGDPHTRSDDKRVVRYEVLGSDLFKKETVMKPFIGMKVETERGDIGEIKSSFGTSGKFRVYFPAGTEAREGDSLLLRFLRFAHDPDKKMHQSLALPPSRPGTALEAPKKVKKKLPDGVKKFGEVSVLKGDNLPDGRHTVAIVSGFFAPEVNIRDHVGAKVLVRSTNESGTVVGPFGKAGKCKVSFESGISAEIGAKAELIL